MNPRSLARVSIRACALLAATATGACARNAVKGTEAATQVHSLTQDRKVLRGGPATTSEREPGVEVRTSTGALYIAPGLENSQRKSLPLLQASIVNCLSANQDVFALSEAMVAKGLAQPAPDAEGKVAFLNSGYLKRPEGAYLSVLEAEKDYLDDPATLRRASVNTSSLDDISYMVAAMTVANVVAFNTGLDAIDCQDAAKARSFAERCLPGEENAILDEVAKKLSAKEACGTTNPFARRKALATFLSSYLFLRAK